ncbi:hypothetical protein J4460_08675 [Candidatus Woesearchaeota archaeon]|nr:MAG: hypothetical protein QS99_C0013G0036 [archaeon GW2011_AR4]MBS3130712.1 hypothetical protein [Candidatus Woesearchaeota archaeon]HIH38825.1 hypothetical protein [Candidatus Woesearchaeota archaeon]HIH49315.1 hypothetical protein [Candidatus Woesearchaeota archaeon]HIJ04352.1 hypothetical protein [Candidatus Woesearchaeota archaeon]
MNTIVCCDRDGTLNVDQDYYLGKDPHWRTQVQFLPGVVEGIKLLKTIPNLYFFIVTNQSGVAINHPEFKDFDEKRMHEVNEFIIGKLRILGAEVDDYAACPYVESAYIEKAARKGRLVHPEYVRDNHPELKPQVGLFKALLEKHGLKIEPGDKVYSLGDRASDIQFGLNIEAKAIFIPSWKSTEDEEEVRVEILKQAFPGRVASARSFLEAAEMILTENKE